MRASESRLALICPASLVLPRTDRNKPETTVRAADYGTLIHYWKETGNAEPEWGAERDIKLLEEKLLLTGTKRTDWWVGGDHEVSFAINLFTLEVQRFGEGEGDPDEWKASFDPRWWLTGTIDYLYWDGRIDDLKTGKWPVAADDNKQLLSYGLLPWVEAGCPVKWSKRASITSWPMYPKTKGPTREETIITGVDLADHLENLRWALEHPEEANVIDEKYDENGVRTEMSPCSFCPCREEHPASSWMTHWKHARLPMCMPGIISRIEKEQS